MKVRIEPGKASGCVTAPPSKSLSHRYLLSAALSEKGAAVKNILWSEDVKAMADCLQALGAEIKITENEAVFLNSLTEIKKHNEKDGKKAVELKVRESGSALRFLIPICLALRIPAVFTGSKRLFERPLDVYRELAEEKGFVFEKKENFLRVSGQLHPGKFSFDAGSSSQFVTGLLFALPLLKGDSEIELQGNIGSRSYIDMTLGVLNEYGINARWEQDRILKIPGNQAYLSTDSFIEGDYSNAAVFEAFNYLNGDVEVEGLRENSLQGDKAYLKYFKKLKEGFSEIDLSDTPDLGPVLFALAGALKGGRFTGTDRLKIKESNRVSAMKEELFRFGISCREEDNAFIVYPSEITPPKTCTDSHHDHRIVMALSLLLTLTGGEIKDAEAINKSFPGFFWKLGKLGIKTEITE